jgi:hypothetical protein
MRALSSIFAVAFTVEGKAWRNLVRVVLYPFDLAQTSSSLALWKKSLAQIGFSIFVQGDRRQSDATAKGPAKTGAGIEIGGTVGKAWRGTGRVAIRCHRACGSI